MGVDLRGGDVGVAEHLLQGALVNGALPPNTSPNSARERDYNIGVPFGNGGGGTVSRLREGIERFLITDINNPGASAQAQSNIWVMLDLLSTRVDYFNHVPGGCNVLYMDGHVEFQRYTPPSEGPVSRAFAEVAGLIAG